MRISSVFGQILIRGLAFLTVLVASPASTQTSISRPMASIVDPGTLLTAISLAPPPSQLSRYGISKILWRADIHLPKGLQVERAAMSGYAPIFLTLTDGRCFKLDFNGAGQSLTKVDLVADDCLPAQPVGAAPPPPAPLPPKPGLTYVGRAWDLIAWTNVQSGETMLIPEHGRSQDPVLTTSMRVIAVGGLGLPDAPMTEVSLIGYLHGQLVASTMMLILP